MPYRIYWIELHSIQAYYQFSIALLLYLFKYYRITCFNKFLSIINNVISAAILMYIINTINRGSQA